MKFGFFLRQLTHSFLPLLARISGSVVLDWDPHSIYGNDNLV